MKAIIITGTPGTGKTALGKALARITGFCHMDLNKLIKNQGLAEGYDRKRKCFIVDEKKLSAFLEQAIRNSREKLIIDSHIAHFLGSKHVELCIVTRCSLNELRRRLRLRKYSDGKIQENLQAEIFEVCLEEARLAGHRLLVVDTTGKKPASLARIIATQVRK